MSTSQVGLGRQPSSLLGKTSRSSKAERIGSARGPQQKKPQEGKAKSSLTRWHLGSAMPDVALAGPIPYARRGNTERAMDDATDVNKVVAAIFAANMCSAKENKHENYLAEYEAFLSLLEARDARAREAAEQGRADSFPQIGR
jgi:hypothetical protein